METKDPRSARARTYLEESIRSSELASWLQGDLIGSDIRIHSVAAFGAREPGSLAFQVGDSGKEPEIERAVICSHSNAATIESSTKIVVGDPRECFLRFLRSVKPDWTRTVEEQSEQLGIVRGSSEIHPSAVLETGVVLGAGCTIEPLAVIKSGTILGTNTYVSAGSVLGTQGPAKYKSATGTISYIGLHYGTLQISSDVEIGNACVILRALLGRTFIGRFSTLGNMVHVGHGAEVHENVWMAANVTVCGHAVIGPEVSIGAGSVIRDNVTIGRGASVGMGSVVVNHVAPSSNVLGVPAREKATSNRSGPAR